MSNYWRTKDGTVLRIIELSDEHLLNIIKMFEEPSIGGFMDEGIIDAWELDPPDGYDECVLEAKARKLIT